MKITIETKDGEKQEIDAYGLLLAAQVGDVRDTTSAFIMEETADDRDVMLLLTGIIHRLMHTVGTTNGKMAVDTAMKAALEMMRLERENNTH